MMKTKIDRRQTTGAAAIVPAYNEAPTIKGVVEVLIGSGWFEQVIVVDDGSEDSTAYQARQAGARVLRLKKNHGKGWALYAGVRLTHSPVLFFVDADLVGLKYEHIKQILGPVLRGEADMSIGFIERGELLNKAYQRLNAPLSGQRALRRELWEKIDFKRLPRRWEPESALNFIAKRYGYRITAQKLSDISHQAKEIKWGWWHGLYHRLRMIGRIALLLVWLKLRA